MPHEQRNSTADRLLPWRRTTLALLGLALAACSGTAPRLDADGQAAASAVAMVAGAPITFMHQAAPQSQGPVVVFQSGLGDDHASWAAVLRQLPAEHEAVVPDRPGYGASPGRAGERSACRIAEEQHALLRQAGLRPPYVLVGHSLGGLYQYVYARMYPQDVAGLVLLDPTHPRLQATLEHEQPAAAALLQLARQTVFSPAMAQEFDAQADCLQQVELQPRLKAPTVLLASTETPLYMGDGLRGMLEDLRQDWLRRSGATLARVPGSGHQIQQDAPQAVVTAIEAVAASAL
ncbi:alpha/beta fold hydrolase [Pseudorhodoferax soli]|uniref:Pimeloyl-ACP methyl ester carboxylesterase n=1 Tax=Pseudorhodoferax soli TaxID=545864 RepID=A0A368XV98_9BURK|nr:alpha/beta hydrolase [Pseudorhodoferax soli]RCW70457.1 pimeloyl-ACP methyl ester carboxylesterase [Pseudorhodoferax soli]